MSRFLVSVGLIISAFSPIQILSGYSLQDSIELSGVSYSYGELSSIIDSYLPEDIVQKNTAYDALLSAISSRFEKETQREKKDYYRKIAEVIQIGKNANSYKLHSQLQEVVLGYSQGGREIRGYYKGDPSQGFHLITANIHGSYEYGTYETAMMLVSELEKTHNPGWFIIPTLNPDGLIEYEQSGGLLNAYLQGRDNLNGVDLNRNFCTQNFIDTDFYKYGKLLKTSLDGCGSEPETQVMLQTLEKYNFKSAVSLHSVGGIIYIPDGSILDNRVIELGKKVQSILSYDFYPNTSSQILTKASVKKYEIDEGNSGQFTGTLDTYIYEKYNIPTILIELSNHGKIEYNLKEIFTLDL